MDQIEEQWATYIPRLSNGNTEKEIFEDLKQNFETHIEQSSKEIATEIVQENLDQFKGDLYQ